MSLVRRARHSFAASAVVLAACGRAPDTAPVRPISSSSSVPEAPAASAAPSGSASARPATVAAVVADTAPSAPRSLGSFGISCGQSNEGAIAEGSLRLPAPWIFERPEFDAIVHEGTVSYVTEAWKADRSKKGCEHQYQVHVRGAAARARFEEQAKKLGATPSVSGMRFRLQVDAPSEGLPFFVMVEPVGGDNVVVNILHPSVDFPACMRAAVESLPPGLRVTSGLVETGAQASYVSIVREEGKRPWCHASFEWFYDTKIFPKVRSWIEQRGHKIGKDKRFDWDDGGDGYATEWSATFYTSRKVAGQ